MFDGAIRPSELFYTLSCRDETWQIDAGAVHGLRAMADPAEPMLLDAFSSGTPDADLRDSSKAKARVTVTKVEPTVSTVDLGAAALDPKQPYKVVIAALPLPKIGVEFEPFGSEGMRLALEALATAHQGSLPSLYVREAGPGAPARFRLIAAAGGYVITSPENDQPLVARIEGLSASTARLAVKRLEHMARWTLTAELNNPATSIQPGDIDLVLIDEDGNLLRGPDIRLEYQFKEGKWVPPQFKLQLINRTVFDLRLMSSVNAVSAIPAVGKNLIIVAALNAVLHFRIFDAESKMVVDTDETQLTEQAQLIEDLRKQLVGLWPPHKPTRSDKDRVIDRVTSICDHIDIMKNAKMPEGRTLYCGLLDIRQTYEVSPLLEAGCVRLGPDDEPYQAFQGKYVRATVPDKLWKQGVVDFKDVLKLIVATQEFDVRLMKQAALDLPTLKSDTRGLPPRRGSLNRLMDRMQTRNLEPVSEGEDLDDWWATQVTFMTVRPLEATPVSNAPGRSVSLAGGVRLLDHPSLKANARLSPAPVTSRALANFTLPRLLRDDPTVCLPFALTATRGGDPGLSTLLLTEVEDYKRVTPDQPLRLQAPRMLDEGEFVLPVGYDGEFFLPLGRANRSSGGTTELVLERLPEPTPDSRSLGASIKIFFQKIVGPWVGSPSEYPILAVADVGPDGEVADANDREKDREAVRARVETARNILLYVHGIIGDTREMAGSAQRGGFAGRYDLILTFDYENLGTTIADNARLLGERLAAVGLGPGHAKSLDIAAHSMGGLVSRWFIERLGGNRVVRKLVMLGTPNGGSPWPRLVDWATVAMALGLNGLTGSPWPSRVLRGLTAALGDPRTALTEMISGSPTLAELSRSPDPGIPYTILTGDTSTIPTDAGPDGKVSRLIGRLFGTSPMYVIANPFFLGAANDVAVAITSMTSIPGRRARPVPVSCDHLTYFSSRAGLAALAEALDRIPPA